MLLTCMDADDAAGSHRIARDLTSSGASLGARVLASHCAELQTITRTEITPRTTALVWRIVDEFRNVRPQLEDLLLVPA